MTPETKPRAIHIPPLLLPHTPVCRKHHTHPKAADKWPRPPPHARNAPKGPGFHPPSSAPPLGPPGRPNWVGIEGRANQAPNPRFPPVPWRQKPVPRASAKKTVAHSAHIRPPGSPLPNDPNLSGSQAGLGGGAVHAMGLPSRLPPTQYAFGSTRPSPIDPSATGLKLWS